MSWALNLTDELANITTATGQSPEAKIRIIRTIVGPYTVDVFIDEIGRFVGIKDINASADFRTIHNRLSSIGTIDVDEIYKDE